jgi:hypothetical protein
MSRAWKWTGVTVGIFLGVLAILTLPGWADELQPNVVDQLQKRLDDGSATLAFDADGHGYLPDLLKALHISRDSQLLVFSASSLQFDRINQKSPRAIYYQDDVAVGDVQDGRFIEIVTSDPQSGVAFYTLDRSKTDKPHFVRRSSECLGCHGLASRWAPGMMVASYSTGPGGKVLNLDPSRLFPLTDDRTPFETRYGGWYVTGTTGTMRHRGNVTFDELKPWEVPAGGLNITSLADRIDLKRYLEPGSDIVSLLTLEHQAGFVNLITRINAQYRSLDKGDGAPGQRATSKDIDESVDELIAYMTFKNEVPLPSPVKGTSTFTTTFPAAGPRDPLGRSLRQFNLNTRLFRYPLTYMIYSQSFDNLNAQARDRVLHGVYASLQGAGANGAAAINILAATRKGLPDFWRPVPEPGSIPAQGELK